MPGGGGAPKGMGGKPDGGAPGILGGAPIGGGGLPYGIGLPAIMGGAAPGGAARPIPRPAGIPRPGPACNCVCGPVRSAGGGPSTLRLTILSPRSMIKPRFLFCSGAGASISSSSSSSLSSPFSNLAFWEVAFRFFDLFFNLRNSSAAEQILSQSFQHSGYQSAILTICQDEIHMLIEC